MDQAEFDRFADEYYAQHASNIAVSGERPEYFAEYKVMATAEIAAAAGRPVPRILDFGSGTGNSIPWFRKHFPASALTCADVSERSMAISRARFPGREHYLRIEDEQLPLPPEAVDLCFSACVFHHIEQPRHLHWLRELRRVTKPDGLLTIFEHNPWNPLTVAVVNSCPFDENARLLSARELRTALRAAGWKLAGTSYRVFFPHALAALRPLERSLRWLCLGAQYCVTARKTS